MTEKSLPESLSLAHLPAWALRKHLVDVTCDLADELLMQGDYDRLEALSALYESTLTALRARDQRGAR